MDEDEEEWTPSAEGQEEFNKGYWAGRTTAVLATIPRLLGWNPDDGTPPRNDWQLGFLAGWRDRIRKK